MVPYSRSVIRLKPTSYLPTYLFRLRQTYDTLSLNINLGKFNLQVKLGGLKTNCRQVVGFNKILMSKILGNYFQTPATCMPYDGVRPASRLRQGFSFSFVLLVGIISNIMLVHSRRSRNYPDETLSRSIVIYIIFIKIKCVLNDCDKNLYVAQHQKYTYKL